MGLTPAVPAVSSRLSTAALKCVQAQAVKEGLARESEGGTMYGPYSAILAPTHRGVSTGQVTCRSLQLDTQEKTDHGAKRDGGHSLTVADSRSINSQEKHRRKTKGGGKRQ